MFMVNTFLKGIRQYKCRLCRDVLMESGCFRFPGMKEIRMVGTWRKENYMIRTLTHPLDPSRIITIDVHCKCNKCGTNNAFIVATALDDKSKIRVQYNRLAEARGKLYT